jgi:hypothetical protein
MVDAFEQSCVPHNRCATAANESLTFTLPKEVSLCAEGDPEEAKAAMYAAAQKSLDAIYGDKRYRRRRHSHAERERGDSLSRPRSGWKIRGRPGDRQAFEPQQQRWRKHGASAARPTKDGVEGGAFPRTL